MKQKILFISHQASLTGAPLVMLYFMEWLVQHHPASYEIGILHLSGGELEERFNKITKYQFKIQATQTSIFSKVARKVLPTKVLPNLPNPTETVINQIADIGFDILYANTASTLKTAIQIKLQDPGKVKIIAHLHEMQASLRNSIRNPDLVVPHLDKIIAVAEVVKNSIQSEWKLENNQVEVVYEFSKIKINSAQVSKENKIFTVGASGTAGWRKGHDLFVQVANYMNVFYPEVKVNFQWVGKIESKELIIVEEDLKKLNLSNVNFVGLQSNPHKFFQNFDVFLMTSKEDPFPLVCIEVGMMGKPIICFDKATGTQEVIKRGGGKIVPYLDIHKMGDAVIDYYNDRELLNKDGKEAITIFSEFTPEIRCPRIYEIIQSL